jgi:hypothetical protein
MRELDIIELKREDYTVEPNGSLLTNDGIVIPLELVETITGWEGPLCFTKLNQSRLKTYEQCWRKGYWQYEEDLVANNPQYPFSVGSAVHKGLELLAERSTAQHEGLPPAGQLLPAPDARVDPEAAVIEATIEAALVVYDTKVATYRPMADELPKVEEHREEVRRLLKAYIREYGSDMEGETWRVVAPEVTGQVAVGTFIERGILFVAVLVFRTDAIISWRNRYYLLEHKTMKANHPMNWAKFNMDIQITAYVWGCTHILGVRVQGAIVNGIIKTKVPQFERHMYTRTDDDLLDFREEFTNAVKDIIKKRLEAFALEPQAQLIVFQKETQACYHFRPCEYLALCQSRGSGNARAQYVRRQRDYVDDVRLLTVPKDEPLESVE